MSNDRFQDEFRYTEYRDRDRNLIGTSMILPASAFLGNFLAYVIFFFLFKWYIWDKAFGG